jgi:hypothetical protein
VCYSNLYSLLPTTSVMLRHKTTTIMSPSKSSTLLLVVTLLSTTTLAQWPNPEPCEGDCRIHDPALLRRDDGMYFQFGSAPNVAMKYAESLTGPWTREPAGALPFDEQLGVYSTDLPPKTLKLTHPGSRRTKSWRHVLYVLSAYGHWHSAF